MALARLALLALGSLRQPQHDYRRDHRNQRAVIRSFGQAEQGSRQLGMQRLVPEVGHLLEPV